MRLFSLTNTHTSRRYRQAVKDAFGVSCNLDEYQVNRGWYHIQVPEVTVQRLFGTDTIMTFKSPMLNARTHDQQDEPYRQYKRPRSSSKWADSKKKCFSNALRHTLVVLEMHWASMHLYLSIGPTKSGDNTF